MQYTKHLYVKSRIFDTFDSVLLFGDFETCADDVNMKNFCRSYFLKIILSNNWHVLKNLRALTEFPTCNFSPIAKDSGQLIIRKLSWKKAVQGLDILVKVDKKYSFFAEKIFHWLYWWQIQAAFSLKCPLPIKYSNIKPTSKYSFENAKEWLQTN